MVSKHLTLKMRIAVPFTRFALAASQPMEESVAVSVEAESDVAEGGLLVVKGVAVEAYSLVYVRIPGVVCHA